MPFQKAIRSLFLICFGCIQLSLLLTGQVDEKPCQPVKNLIDEGNLFIRKNQYTLANELFSSALAEYNQINCKDNELLGNLYLGKAQLMLLSFMSDSASYYLDLSLQTASVTKNISYESKINTAIGMMMNQAKAYDKALYHYQTAAALLESLSEEIYTPRRRVISNYNLGLTYTNLKDHTLAQKHLEAAIEYAKAIGFKEIMIDAHGVLAHELKKLNRLEWRYHLDTALNLSIEIKNSLKTAQGYLFLANHSLEMEDFEQSIQFAKQALGQLTDSSHNFLKPDIYEILSNSYLAVSDFKNAAKSQQLQINYTSFYDSVNNANIALKFDEQLKFKQALASEKVNRLALRKQIQLWIFAFITLLLITTIIVGYKLYKKQSNRWLNAIMLLSRKNKDKGEDKAIDPLLSIWLELSQLIQNEQLFLNKELSLDYLAKLLGTNVNYISKAVNCYAGTNFKGYLNKIRTEYAKGLILEQNSINELIFKEISEAAGFNSIQTFYRSFKNNTGSTPKIWAEQKLLK